MVAVGEDGRLDVRQGGKMPRKVTLIDQAQRLMLLEALRQVRRGSNYSAFHPHVIAAGRYLGISDVTVRAWKNRYNITDEELRWFPLTPIELPPGEQGMSRIDQAKRALLAAALAEHGGSVTAASHMVGISVPTGYAWKKRFRL